jgi:hypothetical protein
MDSTKAKDKLEKSENEVFSRLINALDLNEEAPTVLKDWKAEDESDGFPADRVLQCMQNAMAGLLMMRLRR